MTDKKKPWEQDWTVRSTPAPSKGYFGRDWKQICGPDGRPVVYANYFTRTYEDGEQDIFVGVPMTDEIATFVAGAPAVTRALMGLLVDNPHPKSQRIEHHTLACWDKIYAYLLADECGDLTCSAARSALRESGVEI
ncbi:hypothetical protein [Myxococcus phage Mx1]|nr:hypothetical protein [Myxococcus phage Mx1]